MKDLIDSAVDVATCSFRGDIEIAEDLLKASVWLMALATAALYFSFQELELAVYSLKTTSEKAIFAGYMVGAASLVASFVFAYYLRKSHLHFCGLSRNLLSAYAIMRADMYENLEKVKKISEKATPDKSFVALVYSGAILEHLRIPGFEQRSKVEEMLIAERPKLERYAAWQRYATFLGFLVLSTIKLAQVALAAAI